MCCKVQQGLATPSFRNRLIGSIPISSATTKEFMPCMKCNNGKYKYGEAGRCQFETLDDCKAAAAAIHAKPKNNAAGSVMVAPDSVKVVDRDRNSTVCPGHNSSVGRAAD